MEISRIPDRIWKDIISGKTIYNFDSLSVKILLSSLRLKLQKNPNEEDNYVSELKMMFEKHQNLPTVQNDIKKITEKGGML
jgi:hypothetical protein